MHKIFLTLAFCGLILAGCANKSKPEQLVDVLNEGAEQIQNCKTPEDMHEAEVKIQSQINAIVGDDDNFTPNEEETKMLEPALTSYYKAFAEKAREFALPGDSGTGNPVSDNTESPEN